MDIKVVIQDPDQQHSLGCESLYVNDELVELVMLPLEDEHLLGPRDIVRLMRLAHEIGRKGEHLPITFVNEKHYEMDI